MSDNMKSIATKMTIGLILIFLWIPAVFWSEITSKINNDKSKKLQKKIKNSLFVTGKVKNIDNENHINLNTKFGEITMYNSVAASEKFKMLRKNNYNSRRYYQPRSRSIYNQPKSRGIFGKPKSRGIFGNRRSRGIFGNRRSRGIFGNRRSRGIFGNRRSRGIYERFNPLDNSFTSKINYKGFVLEGNDGNDYEIFRNSLSKNDLENVMTKSFYRDMKPNFNNKVLNNKKYNYYKLGIGSTLTLVAEDESLKKLPDTHLLHRGYLSRDDIIKKNKSKTLLKSWLFRIISGLLLGVGVFLITSPVKYILENAPNLVDFPIIKVFKPILEAGSGAILFFINTFSVFGSGILAIVMTLFVFLLVNFAIPIIILIVGFIVWTIIKNKNKDNSNLTDNL
jgi:hypothetical protein